MFITLIIDREMTEFEDVEYATGYYRLLASIKLQLPRNGGKTYGETRADQKAKDRETED